MLIFLEKQLVVFATPKTGSTSIESAFAPYADIHFKKTPAVKHMRPRKFNRLFEKQVERMAQAPLTKIALIRDPLEWIGSWYRYRSRPALRGHKNSTQDVSFEQFVHEYMKPDNRPPYADLGSQSAFLRMGDGRLGVHHLFRYEAIQSAYIFLSDQLGVAPDLPLKNISPILPMPLSTTLETQFRQKFADDYSLYEQALVDPLQV